MPRRDDMHGSDTACEVIDHLQAVIDERAVHILATRTLLAGLQRQQRSDEAFLAQLTSPSR